MSVYICGDTHIPYDYKKLTSKKWPEQKTMSEDDYLIILGDFGLLWGANEDNEERYYKRIIENRKFTTLFIDGNHENHHRLGELEEVDMLGGKAGKVSDKIYHLKRGHVFEIEGYTLFCMGGADSTDKQHRVIDISWWEQEIPSYREMDFALENLEKHRWCVDFVLTHTAPSSIVKEMLVIERTSDPASRFFQHLLDNGIMFRSWHFGHMHEDVCIKDKFFCHYDSEPYKLI